MKNQIELNDKKIEYTLKISKRARKMRLAVYCDGNFVVTAPRNVNQSLIEQFIIKKAQWVIGKLEYFKNFEGKIIPQSNESNFPQYKNQAMAVAQNRIGYFNELYCFKFNKINIRNQKTRWGSCSKKGNLNFNYKIALLPPRLADYIIVHELCHLGEFNHSYKFWNLVAKTMPDYLERRGELRRVGVVC